MSKKHKIVLKRSKTGYPVWIELESVYPIFGRIVIFTIRKTRYPDFRIRGDSVSDFEHPL